MSGCVNEAAQMRTIAQAPQETRRDKWFPFVFRRLERNIFVGDFAFRRRFDPGIVSIFRRRALGRHWTRSTCCCWALSVGTRAEHLHIAGDDLIGSSFVSGLIFPLAAPDGALDVNLFALGEVLAADFRQLVPCHDPVPLRMLLLLAVAVLERFVRGDGESCDRTAAGR